MGNTLKSSVFPIRLKRSGAECQLELSEVRKRLRKSPPLNSIRGYHTLLLYKTRLKNTILR